MSQQAIANLISRVLGSVAKYSVAAGVGVAALQTSLYTGKQSQAYSRDCILSHFFRSCRPSMLPSEWSKQL